MTLTVLIDAGSNQSVIRKGDAAVVDIIERLRGEWSVQSVSMKFATFGEGQGAVEFYAAIINIKSTYNNS